MKVQTALVILGALCGSSLAVAGPLTECRDAQLQSMSAEELRGQLSEAGGRNCVVRASSWGESVACQGTQGGSRAFGLPVREFSAEVQRESGKRSLQVVTKNTLARTDGAVDQSSAAQGLELKLEPEDTGVTVISCTAQGGAGTDAEEAGEEGN